MARKKKNSTSLVSKMFYLIITLVFFIISNMYLTDLIVEEIKLGLNFSNPFITLKYVQNVGAAFSILEDYPMVVIALAILALILVLVYTVNNLKNISMAGIFCYSLLMSGIFCNLYERLFFGYVRDFIELSFVSFPIFNISDICINLSVLVLIILLFNKNFLKNI